MIEKASDGDQAPNKSLVGWLLENIWKIQWCTSLHSSFERRQEEHRNVKYNSANKCSSNCQHSKDIEVKVKIAVLCFVILCTWYVYSVHNRYCLPMHNLYLLLCSEPWNIYEKNPLSMIVVQRRQSLRHDIQDSWCARIALFPTRMCAVFTVGLGALMFCKNLVWNTLLQTVGKITNIGQVLCAQGYHCQEENHDLPK